MDFMWLFMRELWGVKNQRSLCISPIYLSPFLDLISEQERENS